MQLLVKYIVYLWSSLSGLKSLLNVPLDDWVHIFLLQCTKGAGRGTVYPPAQWWDDFTGRFIGDSRGFWISNCNKRPAQSHTILIAVLQCRSIAFNVWTRCTQVLSVCWSKEVVMKHRISETCQYKGLCLLFLIRLSLTLWNTSANKFITYHSFNNALYTAHVHFLKTSDFFFPLIFSHTAHDIISWFFVVVVELVHHLSIYIYICVWFGGINVSFDLSITFY